MGKKIIKFEKVMTRDAPFIVIAAWHQVFTQAIPEITNQNVIFPEPVFIYNGEAVESWRASQLFFDQTPLAMSRWAKNPQNTKKLLTEFNKYFQIARKIKKEKEKPLKNISPAMALRRIEKVANLFITGGASLISGYWCVTWNDEAENVNNDPLFTKEILTKGAKMRQNDSLFDDVCGLIYNYLYLIAQEKKWPKDLMKLFILSELKKAISTEGKYDFSEMRKRKNGCAYFDNRMLIKNDIPKTLKKLNYKLIEEKVPKLAILKGVVASPGTARGKIKIVMNREQMKKVMKGDILASSMTTPAFLPAMIKASGFITDEGGIICHAAIVSREMKKPCIVGTKIATKILKDGDLVHLDANNGIAKIIKRKNNTHL